MDKKVHRTSRRQSGAASLQGAELRKAEQRQQHAPEPSSASRAPSQAQKTNDEPSHQGPLIVGIGASAGGLEALDQFFRHTPSDSGMAFVIVQHLDPANKHMLVEILQRITPIKVTQAEDGVQPAPDHIYVIPPDKELSISRGALHLQPRKRQIGVQLPIDLFFRCLADDQGGRSIGVLLSGTGSDGTLGLRAIKEAAGTVFVQALYSANFEGMPRSAIDAGLADVVAPAHELCGKIVAYLHHKSKYSRADLPLESHSQTALGKIYSLLRAKTGNDFSLYKTSTLYRRIERRMGLHQIDSIANYARFLSENVTEPGLLFKELLIGVTHFFRDSQTWEHLKRDVLPQILQQRAKASLLRAWVPACSTGEEAYTLAIIFKEVIDKIREAQHTPLKVFATDLDQQAIDKARHGLYPKNIAADVSPRRLRRFFVREPHGYRVNKEIRDMVVFAPQNLVSDPPFTKLDLISCRNLLIYLSADLQHRVMSLFHYSLNPHGVLLLGNAETVGEFHHLFTSIDQKNRTYERIEQSGARRFIGLPTSAATIMHEKHDSQAEDQPESKSQLPDIQALADRVVLKHFGPVGVLCNDRGDILYISGHSGKYLEPSVGKANYNIFAMARTGLRHALSATFSRATSQDKPARAENVTIECNDNKQVVTVVVQRLREPSELNGTILVTISDQVTGASGKRLFKGRRSTTPSQREQLEHELRHAREEVQSAREEMQTSQEELKSTNEELQSTNEELQSSNEELTTSREEMQSLNEELQTVNHQLQNKVEELSRINSDMNNLLNSTDIATLFLDGEMKVRSFTTATAKIIKLISEDVGRAITDIASDLDYNNLDEDAREVVRTLILKQRFAATRDGRQFNIRIMPYRTVDNIIDGVVITFTDIGDQCAAEARLLDEYKDSLQFLNALPVIPWRCNADGFCDYLGHHWQKYTKTAMQDSLGANWFKQVHPDDRDRVRREWHDAVTSSSIFVSYFRLRCGINTYRGFKSEAVPVRDANSTKLVWFGTHTDVNDLEKSPYDDLRERHRVLCAVFEHVSEAVVILDKDLKVVFCNKSVEKLLQCSLTQMNSQSFTEAVPGISHFISTQRLQTIMQDGATLSTELFLHDDGRGPRLTVRMFAQSRPTCLILMFTQEGDNAVQCGATDP